MATFQITLSDLDWTKDRIPYEPGGGPGFEVRFHCKGCHGRVWYGIRVNQLANLGWVKAPAKCKCGGAWTLCHRIRRVTRPIDKATKQPFRAQPASTRE